MDPNTNQQDNHSQASRDILEALGGSLPQVIPQKKAKSPVIFIAAVVAVIIFIFVLIIVVVTQPKEQNTGLNENLSAGISLDVNSPELAYPVISNFTNLLGQQNYKTAQTYIHPLSALGGQDLTKTLVENFSGSGVKWETCTIDSIDEYTVEEITDLDGITYESVFVPVLCEDVEAGSRTLDFGVRKSADTEWQIYDILSRKL